MNNFKDDFKNRFNRAIDIRNIKPIELSAKTGIAKSTISHYMTGYTKPKSNKLYILAEALDVNEAWLMGFDVPMERDPDKAYWENEKNREMSYHEFIHSYLGYESPYTLDGNVDIKLTKEPEAIYRVSAKEYNDFYDFTKERIDREFSFLLSKAQKYIETEQSNIISVMPQDKSYLEPIAAHNDNAEDPEQQRLMEEDLKKMDDW